MDTVRRALGGFVRGLLPGVLGILLVTELVALAVLLVGMFGVADPATDTGSTLLTTPWWTGAVTRRTLFVLVSLSGGALGGALHGIASLTQHVGEGDFAPRWTLWYLTNPAIGAALAAVFLFVLQAGLGGQTAATSQNGLYGVAAVAALTGLFSRHALDKLKDVFDVVFASRASVEHGYVDAARDATTLAAAGRAVTDDATTASHTAPPTEDVATGEGVATGAEAPVVAKLVPSQVRAGHGELELEVVGEGLGADPSVEVGGAWATVLVAEAGSVTVLVPARLLARPGTLEVRVLANGASSVPATLQVL